MMSPRGSLIEKRAIILANKKISSCTSPFINCVSNFENLCRSSCFWTQITPWVAYPPLKLRWKLLHIWSKPALTINSLTLRELRISKPLYVYTACVDASFNILHLHCKNILNNTVNRIVFSVSQCNCKPLLYSLIHLDVISYIISELLIHPSRIADRQSKACNE